MTQETPLKNYLKEEVRFVMRTEQVIGDGIALNLPDHLAANGWRRIGLVLDSGLKQHNPYLSEVVENLEKNLESVHIVVNEMAEPTYDYLNEVKDVFAPHDLDCVVGIGGGSTLDLAKGLATLKSNPGDAIQYRGFGKVTQPPLPVVALPSTAGTGSEVTPYAVFIDTEAQWKFGINSEYNYPRLALYDPRFLDSCTLPIFASAGLDAMTHTLESFAAKGATLLSRVHSIQAFKLLWEGLGSLAEGDRSTETKIKLLVGSGCAGAALMNSGAGPSGALSYPLGVYFKVPHGIAGSVFLPGVIRFNVENGYTEYGQLYAAVAEDATGDEATDALRFADELRDLCAKLGIPTSLEGFGVKDDEDRDQIIEGAFQLEAAFAHNPVTFGPDEIRKLVYSL